MFKEEPLVSIGLPVHNGEEFLAQTLDSLLSQDYTNIEIVILDNISTDSTSSICKSYMKKDARVKYILDNKRRDVIEGVKKVVEYCSGNFHMGCCDDDIYEPGYIRKLMDILLSDSTIGLAYTNFGYINPKGEKRERKRGRIIGILNQRNSNLKNFALYLWHRIPIPIAFGLMKTEVFKKSLESFHRVDHWGWNHDNLFILKLLSFTKIFYISETLFYYRERDRDVLYCTRGESDTREFSFISRIVKNCAHQGRIAKEVVKILNESPFTTIEKIYLKLLNLIATVNFCTLRFLYSSLRHKSKKSDSLQIVTLL